jgi:glutaredoxin
MRTPLPPWVDRTRRYALYLAAGLALLLLGLDRYAAIAHRPGPDSTRVAIYTTEWCPYCAKLRTSLAASGVSYVEYDVETSLQGQLGFWALRGRGVPVSAVGPEIVYGYDVPRLTAAMNRLGHTFQPVADRAVAGASQSALQ